MKRFSLQTEENDLFTCPDDHSLVHCVSADLKMSKGIAVLFKKKFGGVTELKRQDPKVGNFVLLKQGPRFVYYLVTKQRYFEKPTMKTLEQSLIALRDHSVENKITHVSMPRIGCGLDGLDWKRVKETIEKVFAATNIQITVYIPK